MPNFPWPDRWSASSVEDAVLSALLAGTEIPADSGAGLKPVADVLDALKAPTGTDEFAGETVAMAEFHHWFGLSAPPNCRSRRRRPTLITSLLSAKAAAVAAIAAVGVGTATAAAFAGALPGPVQNFAHQTIGAPAAHQDKGSAARPSGSATPVGPNASSDAAFGLCTAYKHATEHGTAAQKAIAFRNLVKAAGGAGNVAAFCAAVPHPGTSPSPHPTGPPSTHPTGPPSTHPTGPPSPHPSGPPSPHPTGPPSTHP
jgi:hypothetical protein